MRKIRDQIGHWFSKLLTYAGRIQLIQAVLFSVQVFWSRHFLLPKAVLYHMDQLCSIYLWHGKEQKVKDAQVSWKDFFFPSSKEG